MQKERKNWRSKGNLFTVEKSVLEDTGWRFWKEGEQWVVIPGKGML